LGAKNTESTVSLNFRIIKLRKLKCVSLEKIVASPATSLQLSFRQLALQLQTLTDKNMNTETFDEIWADTLGQTLEITEENSLMTNGLRQETSNLFREAANLTEDEIAARLESRVL